MTTNEQLNARLRNADPVGREPALPAETLAEMRRTIVSAAAPAHVRPAPFGPRVFAVAAAAVLIGVATVTILRRPEPVRPKPEISATALADQSPRMQVHFSTPGGTRIIWTIDPTFQLKEARR